MPPQSAHGDPLTKWNRKLLNAYWLVSLLTLLTSLCGWYYLSRYTDGFEAWPFVRHHILLPLLFMLVTLTTAEISNRSRFRYNPYIMIVAGSLMAATLVGYHSSLDGAPFFFLVPMVASVFYFQARLIIVSFGTNVLLFTVLRLIEPELRAHVDGLDYMITLFFLVSGLIICRGIIGRGAEIQQNLVQTISEQQDLMVQNILMDKLSKTDALTELYNHKTFHEYLDKLIDQSDHHGLSLHLAVLDIDNFKRVNDTYGHWVGDLILKQVSRSIREQVSLDDFAARYGGEEFAIIFTDKSARVAKALSEAIRAGIESVRHPELDGAVITVSIGLKTYVPHCGKEWLFRGADEALYTAKRTGKNRTVLHRETNEAV